MDLGLAAAFGAGVLTFLSPCILPMIPILLGILLGASAEGVAAPKSRGALLRSVSLFALGFTVVFSLLGLGASSVGDLLREHRTLLLWIGAGFLALFGMRFLGWLRLPFLERSATLKAPKLGNRGLDALAGGVVFGLGWTPCAGPILGSVLTLAAATAESPFSGAALLVAYSGGIALPLLVLGAFGEALLPRLRRLNQHLPRIERATGALLLVGAVALAAGAGWPLSVAADETGPSVADNGQIEPALGEATAQPRLVEFYGEDCTVCARMEPVVEALRNDCAGKHIEVLSVSTDEATNRGLARRHGIQAVPTFIALDVDGAERVRFVGERNLDELRSVAALLLDRSCAGIGARQAAEVTQTSGPDCPGTTPSPASVEPATCGG